MLHWLLGRKVPVVEVPARVSDEYAEEKLSAASNALVTARANKTEAREVSDKIQIRLLQNHLGEGLTELIHRAKGTAA